MSFLKFKLQFNGVCYQSIRMAAEFKFTGNQKVQQNRILNNFYYNKDKKKLKGISQTCVIKPKPIIVSKGRHNYILDEKEKSMTRRMKVLNKLFTQCIAEIISTQNRVDIKPFNINITRVRISKDYTMLNVYWYSPTISDDKSIESIARILEKLKGKLHEKIIEVQVMAQVPWINFVLDTFESNGDKVVRLLKEVDIGSDSDEYKSESEIPYQKVDCYSNVKPTSKFSESRATLYDYLTIQKPSDMKMDVFGLDYEYMMNFVLADLKKSRAQHRSFNAVADPLPPNDWSLPLNRDETFETYDTDNRIKQMKRFLIENRKKKQRLSREARNMEFFSMEETREELLDSKQRMEESFLLEDIQDPEQYTDDEDMNENER